MSATLIRKGAVVGIAATPLCSKREGPCDATGGGDCVSAGSWPAGAEPDATAGALGKLALLIICASMAAKGESGALACAVPLPGLPATSAATEVVASAFAAKFANWLRPRPLPRSPVASAGPVAEMHPQRDSALSAAALRRDACSRICRPGKVCRAEAAETADRRAQRSRKGWHVACE